MGVKEVENGMIGWLIAFWMLLCAPFSAGLLLGYIRIFRSWRIPRFGVLEFIVAMSWAVLLATLFHPDRNWLGIFLLHLMLGFPAVWIGCWLFYRSAQMLRRRQDR